MIEPKKKVKEETEKRELDGSFEHEKEEKGKRSKLKGKERLDSYEIPDKLPKPKKLREPNIIPPIFAGIISSILLGGLFGLITQAFYIFFLFETLCGFALAFTLYQALLFGNYSHYKNLRTIMGFSVLAIVFISRYTEYMYAIHTLPPIINLGFIDFLKTSLEAGVKVYNLDLGSIGWIVLLILQVVIIYYATWRTLLRHLLNYQLQRIPDEVIEFVFYHIVKGKSEEEVRTELSKMGWVDRHKQNYVFESISALHGVIELNEMK